MEPTLLNRLRALPLPFHQPASSATISRTEEALGGRFPDSLASLYRHHNGEKVREHFHYRLLPLRDVVRTHQTLGGTAHGAWLQKHLGLVIFWKNKAGESVALALREPFHGVVFCTTGTLERPLVSCRSTEAFYADYIPFCEEDLLSPEEHEDDEADDSQRPSQNMQELLQGFLNPFLDTPPEGCRDPVAAELARWYVTDAATGELRPPNDSIDLILARQGGRAWKLLTQGNNPEQQEGVFDLATHEGDFFGPGLLPHVHEAEKDPERVLALRRLLQDEDAQPLRRDLAAAICAFTPKESSDALIPLLDHPQEEVAAIVARSLELRLWEPALAALGTLAMAKRGGASHAARQAMRAIKPPTPEEVMAEVARVDRSSKRQVSALLRLLGKLGAQVIEHWSANKGNEVRVRLPGEAGWRTLLPALRK